MMVKKPMMMFYPALILIISIFSGMNMMGSEGMNGSFGGGNGTLSDPYIIEDVWDLQNISSDLSAHYILKNNISAAITKTWNLGEGFEPIDSSWDGFLGSLDGCNFTIFDLYINRSTKLNAGLFRKIGSGGCVKNISLMSFNIIGKESCGGLAGTNYYGTVSNCTCSGNLTGNDRMGGLIGSNFGIVTNCIVKGTVKGKDEVGGLLGNNYENNVSMCHTYVNVNGDEKVGGLIGCNYKGKISHCHSRGNITGKDREIGGLIGESGGFVTNCTATGNISGDDISGGLVGNNQNTLFNCTSNTNITGNDMIGGLVGRNNANVFQCESFGKIAGTSYIGGLVGINYHEKISKCNSTCNILGKGYQ